MNFHVRNEIMYLALSIIVLSSGGVHDPDAKPGKHDILDVAVHPDLWMSGGFV
jgi:hypothetical protein